MLDLGRLGLVSSNRLLLSNLDSRGCGNLGALLLRQGLTPLGKHLFHLALEILKKNVELFLRNEDLEVDNLQIEHLKVREALDSELRLQQVISERAVQKRLAGQRKARQEEPTR